MLEDLVGGHPPSVPEATEHGAKALDTPRVRFHDFLGANVHFRSNVLHATINAAAMPPGLSGIDAPAILSEFKRELDPDDRILTDAQALCAGDASVGELAALCRDAILLAESYVRAEVFRDSRIAFSAIVNAPPSDRIQVVWETDAPRLSRSAATLALQFLAERGGGSQAEEGRSYAERRRALDLQVRKRRLSEQSAVLRSAARARGLSHQIIDPRRIRIGTGACQKEFNRSLVGSTPLGATKLALDRHHLFRRLADLSLPTPKIATVATAEDAVAALDKLRRPALLRRARSDDFRTVAVDGPHSPHIAAAFEMLRSGEKTVVVEERFDGQEHHLLVVGGKLVAAAICQRPRVFGDGDRSVTELVDTLVADTSNADGPQRNFVIDASVRRVLLRQGLKPDSVPGAGVVVTLSRTVRPSRGGWSRDVTDIVHQDVRAAAERAARATGLRVAGVQIVTSDISCSFAEVGGGIVGISSAPGLRMFASPSEGPGRNVGGAILDMLAADANTVRVPAALVVGSHGANAVTKSLAAMLAGDKAVVGACLKTEALVGSESMKPAARQAEAQSQLARSRAVTVLATAMSPNRILSDGLGLDLVDAAMILPVREGEAGPERLDALRLLAKSPDAVFLIDSDDRDALAVVRDLAPTRLIRVRAAAGRGAAGGGSAIVAMTNGRKGKLMTLSVGGKRLVSMRLPGSKSEPSPEREVRLLRAFALQAALRPEVREAMTETFDDD